MKNLKKNLVAVCCSSLTFLGLDTTAMAHSSAKKRSRTYKHSHDHESESKGKSKGHSHDHHHHSPFSLGMGMAVSKAFGESEHDHEHAEGEEEHTHLQGAALHGGHGGGGTPGEAGGEPDGQPYFSLNAGYEITERWQLNLTQGFSTSEGIADTALGVTYHYPFSSRLKLSTQAFATAPVSQESKESYKMTTVMIGAGPTWEKGRWEIGGKAYLAKSYYSKTIVIEEQTTETPLMLQEEPVDEHALEELGATGDREFDRYGFESEVAYKFARRWQFGVGVGASMATKQWGPKVYETEATLAQVTYNWKSLTTGLGFMVTSEAESFEPPKTPTAAFNIMYVYE